MGRAHWSSDSKRADRDVTHHALEFDRLHGARRVERSWQQNGATLGSPCIKDRIDHWFRWQWRECQDGSRGPKWCTGRQPRTERAAQRLPMISAQSPKGPTHPSSNSDLVQFRAHRDVSLPAMTAGSLDLGVLPGPRTSIHSPESLKVSFNLNSLISPEEQSADFNSLIYLNKM